VAEERLQRKLAAILSADVVGYSRLMGIDEAGTLAGLKSMRRDLIDPVIAAHSGRTIKLIGDGSLVEFGSVVDAVTCALEIQNSIREHNDGSPEEGWIQFRMGINVGDVIVDGDDIYGDGVNVAARIEALAEPGGIYVSRAVADEVRDKLPIKLETRGERRVKNVARPIEVFRVSAGEAGSTMALDAGLRSPALLMHWPPESDRDRSPYRGLKPLETVDAGIFFGRDAPIAEGIDRIRSLSASGAARLLVILGASGAGKSSFLRAGLLPQLEHDSSHFMPLPVMRPGRSALFGENGLLGAVEAVLPNRTRADIRAAIREGDAGVRRLLLEFRSARARRPQAGGLQTETPVVVFAIDQAEELFRIEGADESAALLTIIRGLALQEQPAVIVIFAIRSDSYDALQHAKPLEGLAQSAVPLLPMPRVSYKEVIEGPARRLEEAGGRLTIEPQLTQRLLGDIEKGGGSDALPLLAFTLEQLYLDYRPSGALRLGDYEKFGGLKGAIDAAVERALARADDDSRIPRDRRAREALLRRGLIPWLAGIDPDSKAPRRNIARRNDIPAEAAPLINLLVEERLLSSDTTLTPDPATGQETRVSTIEPTHEALLRQWGLLEGWLQEDFALLATLEGVKRAARDWDANARAEAWLAHQGQRLAEAQVLDARPDIAAKLDAIDRQYLAECQAKEEAAREAESAANSRRRRLQAAIYMLLVGVIAGLIGWINQAYITEQWRWWRTDQPFAAAHIWPYVLESAAEHALKPRDIFKECSAEQEKDYCPQMVVLPAGSFIMGSPATEPGHQPSEQPQHLVTIAKPFAVSKFELTFDEWDTCVDYGDCPQGITDSGWGRGRQPVINVTWGDAQRYVAWWSKMTGRPYRLLTEAEYEYSARAGSTTAYPWDDNIGQDNANCKDCGSQWDNKQTAPVGSFAANGFGLFDTVGNVWEWVEDCLSENYQDAPTDGSAGIVGRDCNNRIVRGGSWQNTPDHLRSAARLGPSLGFRDNLLGFRIGRTLNSP